MSRKTYATAIGSVVVLLTAVTACSGGPEASSKKGDGGSGGTLTVAAASGINTLNPIQNGTGLPNQLFIQPAYDSLIVRSPDGELEPGLATSWSYSDHNREFHMTIRKGVEFSNGQPLTARAVAKWIKWFKASDGLFSARFSQVEKIGIDGKYKLTMYLSKPDAAWPSSFVQDRYGYVICPRALSHPKWLGTHTCGAGPYVLDPKQTVSGQKYVYVRNPKYWNKTSVHWQKLIVQVLDDPNSVVSAMSSGQVDVAIGNAQTAGSAKSSGLSVVTAPLLWDAVELLDRGGEHSKPLGDPKVRQALQYAVDRSTVTKAVFGDYAKPTKTLVAEGIPGYDRSLGSKYKYDPEFARKLLKKAGYPNGFKFTMLTWNRNGLENRLAQAIVPYFKKIGVDVKLDNQPPSSAQIIPSVLAKKWPALIFFGQAEAPNLLVQEQLVSTAGALNPFKYEDQHLMELYGKYNRETNSRKQEAVLVKMQSWIDEQSYYIPISISDVVYFHRKNVTGLKVSSGEPIMNINTLKPAE